MLVTLCARLLKNEPIPEEVEVGVEPELVVVGSKLCPSVEVLSCKKVRGWLRRGAGEETYGDNVVFFHESWLMACK